MKHDYRGETAKPIQGSVSSPKQTDNHTKIANTVSNGKETGNVGIANEKIPPPRK